MSGKIALSRFLRVMPLVSAALVSAAGASAQEVARFTANSPTGIVSGPGGAVWFADQGLRSIRRIDADGRVREFPVNGSPQSLAAGADGNLWYTLMSPARIGRMTPTGQIREFALPVATVELHGIVASPDGGLWFAESDTYRIGRITTSGIISEFAVLPTASWVGSIASGPDGNLWFVQPQASRVGRVTPTGEVTEFVVSRGQPIDVSVAADGSVRFAAFIDESSSTAGRISPSGEIEEHTVTGWVDRALASPDGSLWMAGYGTLQRVMPNGVLVHYPSDAIVSNVRDLEIGPDGAIWVAVDTDGWGSDGSVLRFSLDTSPCVADARTLCLNDGRFRVTAYWETGGGANGRGRAAALGSGSGYFWFFDPSNVELVVKVLDGCAANRRYWTFAAGLTQVGVTLIVTDTATGVARTYASSPDAPFVPVQDTAAFPCT